MGNGKQRLDAPRTTPPILDGAKPTVTVQIVIHNDAVTGDTWVPVVEVVENDDKATKHVLIAHWHESKYLRYVGKANSTTPTAGIRQIEFSLAKGDLYPIKFEIDAFGEPPTSSTITILTAAKKDGSAKTETKVVKKKTT